MGHFGSDEGTVTGHTPVKSERVRVPHDVKEILVKKGLTAGDAKAESIGAEILFYIVEDMLPFGCGKGRFLGNVTTFGTAVETMLVTVNRKFEK